MNSRAAQPGSHPERFPTRSLDVGLLIVAVGLIFAYYWPLYPDLVRAWNEDPNYSHGFLVPVLSAGFAWMAWSSAGRLADAPVPRRDFAAGLFQIGFGIVLHWGMWYMRNLFLDVVSMICVLRGLLLVWGGESTRNVFSFSVLFLMFAAPLPISWYQPFAIRMQQLVSYVSTGLLAALGVPVYKEGYLIHLPGFTMEVAEACSGLRQLVAIVALGVTIGHLSGRGRFFRWTLGIMAIPIAVLANCFRVVVSGLLVMFVGPQFGEGAFHTLEGLAIVALSAGLLVAVASALSHFDDRRRRNQAGPKASAPIVPVQSAAAP